MFLIIINFKLIGVILQGYAIYEFFKSIAVRFLAYLKFIPVLGPYIDNFLQSNKAYQKKNDSYTGNNKV